MEKVKAINPERIIWCCKEQGIVLEDLSNQLNISINSLEKVIRGEDAITVNQLFKIATFFNRSLLFFLESGAVNERNVYSTQFRTLTNQKPTLSAKLKGLVERIEKQRKIYLSLLEDLGENVYLGWSELYLTPGDHTKKVAAEVRQWLGLKNTETFDGYRSAIESKGILVFVTNSYKGQWQIAKENPIRGFSLFFPEYPVITVKKQESEGAQTFTLMHELGHLLLHKDSFIDDEDDFYSYQGKEKVANAFAGNVLVPDGFLKQIDLSGLPLEISAYDAFLKSYCRQWSVSAEMLLRRLSDEGLLPIEQYQNYRDWKQRLIIPQTQGGGKRYRYKEPERMFGKPFVRTVLEAVHSKQITLAKASTYLDNLKVSDIHQLEGTRV